MKSKTAVLIALFVISVTTLVMAIFGDNRTAFTVATLVSHTALVLFGYFYAKNRNEDDLRDTRNDIFGSK